MSRASGWLALFVSLAACQGERVDPVVVDAGNADSAVAETGATELLKNVDFELGCAGWKTYNATAEETTEAHAGTRACRVCSIAGAYDFGLWQAPAGAPEIGKTYVADAWVHAAPADAGGVANAPYASLETWQSDVDPVVEANTGTNVTLDASWKRVSSLLTVTKTAATLRFAVRAYDGSTCFLIDDASLHLAP